MEWQVIRGSFVSPMPEDKQSRNFGVWRSQNSLVDSFERRDVVVRGLEALEWSIEVLVSHVSKGVTR